MKFNPRHIIFFSLYILLVLPSSSSAFNDDISSDVVDHDGAYDLMNLYLQTARHFESKKSYERAIVQYQLAKSEALDKEDEESLVKIYFNLGQAYSKLSKIQISLEYYFKALSTNAILKDNKFRSKTLRRIASAYQTLGEFETSYDYQLQALQISEAAKDSISIATSYYELGTIFFYQDRYQQALDYYKQAKELFDVYAKVHHIYACLAAIGSAYERLGQIELALDYNLQSLRIAEESGYNVGVAYAAHNIGSNYTLKQSYDRALKYLYRSMHMKLELKDKWGLIGTYRSIALVYIRSNQFEKSKEYLEKALDLAKEMDTKSRITEIYKFYADAYASVEKHEEAYDYLMKFVSMKDSVLNETTLKEMGEKKSMYEIQKREAEINLLKKQQVIFQKENQINKLYKYILIGSALFFLLIINLLYSRYRLQRKTNSLLEEKNAQINLQNDQLELANAEREAANALLEKNNKLLEEKNNQINSQNEKLETSNEDLKQFAYVASHDLKEPLRMIGSYTTLLKKRYHHLFDENAAEFMGFITDAVGRMETMLTDLLSYSRVNTQQQVHEPIESRNIVEIVITTLHLKIKENNVKVNVDYEQFPQVKGSRTQMLQLFQNLISNALKFTNADHPEIEVGCFEGDKGPTFFVRDNGIGIAEENKSKIFEMFRRLHSRDEFEGSGIGLSTCKKIVEKHGGEIWLESEVGAGSTFFFTIPGRPVPTEAAEIPQKEVLLPQN